MQGEVIGTYATVQQVDDAILKRYLELVESANPEDLARLLDSWAKYIAARRNSDVFEREESEEDKINRVNRDAIQEALQV